MVFISPLVRRIKNTLNDDCAHFYYVYGKDVIILRCNRQITIDVDSFFSLKIHGYKSLNLIEKFYLWDSVKKKIKETMKCRQYNVNTLI